MNNIKLRALTFSDIDKTLKWNNQSEISDMYSGHPFPVNLEMEKKWYEKVLTSNIPVTIFGVEYLENNALIGLTVLREINLINRNAEYAIYIGEDEYRGKGLAKEATLKTLEFGFNKLGLERISLKVINDNSIAFSLYEKLGFKIEGVTRNSVYKNGNFRDETIMSILRDEYQK